MDLETLKGEDPFTAAVEALKWALAEVIPVHLVVVRLTIQEQINDIWAARTRALDARSPSK